MATKLQKVTQQLVESARAHAGSLLTLERQLLILGDEAAQLASLPTDARVKLLGHGLMDPDVVAESSPEELAPVYLLGKKRGRLTEERYAATVTPEVQAQFPYAAVCQWLSEGEWTQKNAEGPNKLRAALLTFVLTHFNTFGEETRAEVRKTLVSVVFNALMDDAKKEQTVAVIRAVRESGAHVDDIILTQFSALEIAVCAKPAWSFLLTALDLVGQAASQEEKAQGLAANLTSEPAPGESRDQASA